MTWRIAGSLFELMWIGRQNAFQGEELCAQGHLVFLSELEKSQGDRNEMTHYQRINEKATLVQCFWINIQVTFQRDELFLSSSQQNKAHFQPDSPNALCVKAVKENINLPETRKRHALQAGAFPKQCPVRVFLGIWFSKHCSRGTSCRRLRGSVDEGLGKGPVPTLNTGG